ncbi:MAG: bifunctional 2-polyprenyl-6-hydroxyphenol methylase/3-demethylubiquinol 3-O-methyltransferase UbiG [Chloroflexota bacterium]
MPVDNDIYNRIGEAWWTDEQPLALLRTGINPPRLAYFRSVLAQLGIDPCARALLDIGCGGGFLSEEWNRLGCRVTGLDPSVGALSAASAHARDAGLDITYDQGSGEHLPYGSNSFSIVSCCDVLEHVTDLDRVIAEAARVLQPGGVFLYDTINRTWQSQLALITFAQNWPPTRVLPFRLHDFRLFIKPVELTVILKRHGLESSGTVGLRPTASSLSTG